MQNSLIQLRLKKKKRSNPKQSSFPYHVKKFKIKWHKGRYELKSWNKSICSHFYLPYAEGSYGMVRFSFCATYLHTVSLHFCKVNTVIKHLPLNNDSSSYAFPAVSLGFTIFGEIFAYVTASKSNHRGSCIPSSLVAGACWVCFLLPVFTHQGHECQDLSSLCDGMHVSTD